MGKEENIHSNNIVTYRKCLQTRFGLVIGFTAYFQMVTTSNYNVLANSYTRLLTTAHTKFSQFVFTSRFLLTDPNNGVCLRLTLLANIS
jgi:hypothetical protein